MIKKSLIILVVILLLPITILASDQRNVEIFHIEEQKVVKEIKPNKIVTREALKYLHNITGIYPNVNPIPDKGYMIRIPFEAPEKVENKFLKSFVDEIIVVFPQDKQIAPFLIVFENDNRLMCYTYKGNIALLLKNLNIRIK